MNHLFLPNGSSVGELPVSWTSQNQVGPYRLLSIVGSGRNCQVWDAMHDGRNERRALKIFLPHLAKDRQLLSLMRHELRVGKNLDHENVIHIYEMRTDRDATYLVMELFAAQNLKQLLLQGFEAMAHFIPGIVPQMVAGLGYLHSQGWIHRDVKPDNFLIDREGKIKLIDFALAERKKGALARLLSRRGKVQGTRSYMSPEQIRGKPVDQRSDMYSLGCVLHEVVSGKPPFTGQSTNDLLNKHLKAAPPSLEAAGRDVTSAFSQLVRRMLAKEPKDRPQSMTDVAGLLREIKIFNRPPVPAAEKN